MIADPRTSPEVDKLQRAFFIRLTAWSSWVYIIHTCTHHCSVKQVFAMIKSSLKIPTTVVSVREPKPYYLILPL